MTYIICVMRPEQTCWFPRLCSAVNHGRGLQWAVLWLLMVFIIPQQPSAAQAPATEAEPNPTPDAPAEEAQPTSSPPVKRMLLQENFPNGEWAFFGSKKESALKDTWKLVKGEKPEDLTLVCTGEPYGYIRTRQVFGDFELGLQWRYPKDENGNSGLLLFTAGEDRLWPDSLQIQLHHSTAGSTFPGGAAKADNELRNVPLLSRPPGQWNECVVTSEQGRVTVVINGKKVGEVTGCTPNSGTIALQSEGSEIHFRQIWIKELGKIESTMSQGMTPPTWEEFLPPRIRRRLMRNPSVSTDEVWIVRDTIRRGRNSNHDFQVWYEHLPANCTIAPGTQAVP
ncbi:MAG: DUF1080 domain-containing protein [Planctomycetaceae bacterium]|nr:DUF1080 domain-containing protein [Planctomycetaceae bacterium]